MGVTDVRYRYSDKNEDDDPIKIAGYYVIERNPAWFFPLHIHTDTVDVGLITSGKGYLFWDCRTFPVEKGDLLIYNKGVLHGESSSSLDPVEVIGIRMSGVHINGLSNNCILEDNVSPIIKTGNSFQLMKALFHCVKTTCDNVINKPADEDKNILYHSANMTLAVINSLKKDQLKPVFNFEALMFKDYIDDNYLKPMHMNTLINEFHFSKTYINKVFKELMGCSVPQYIKQRRLGEVCRLLLYTDIPIKEIALNVGFLNLNHFYNLFTKHMKIAPGIFRKKYSSVARKSGLC